MTTSTSLTIYDAGNYSVSKLANKHYVVYYEDTSDIDFVKSFAYELSAVKFCDMMQNKLRGLK